MSKIAVNLFTNDVLVSQIRSNTLALLFGNDLSQEQRVKLQEIRRRIETIGILTRELKDEKN